MKMWIIDECMNTSIISGCMTESTILPNESILLIYRVLCLHLRVSRPSSSITLVFEYLVIECHAAVYYSAYFYTYIASSRNGPFKRVNIFSGLPNWLYLQATHLLRHKRQSRWIRSGNSSLRHQHTRLRPRCRTLPLKGFFSSI